jgi:Cysteine rich repeat
MKGLAFVLVCCLGAAAREAPADEAAALAVLRAGCADDAQKFCSNVQPGGGRVLACLKEHKDELSDRCKQAAAQAMSLNGSGQAASNTSNATTSPAAAIPAASSASDSSASTRESSGAAAKTRVDSSHAAGRTSASSATSGGYLRLKKVQIIDPGAANVQTPLPAFDLLIPTTWSFKGTVNFGGGKGGCFSDFFAVSWEASSADGSIVFQGAPNYSWQYTDDQAELRKLNDPLRRALGAGGKPCPIMKPLRAEDYFRQNVLSSLPPSTVVSVEPFPELNEIARKQMGMPPSSTGNGDIRTEAIKVRTELQKDGKPAEAWLALAVVTRIYHVGRGVFYDCHAIDFVALRAPKGKLDANDHLFKVMISSIRPEPQWQAYSNGTIAKFYKIEAQKEAVEDQAWANLQNLITQTVLDVTANQMRGSQNSFIQADQGIRGVQTFRDPSTGKMVELSNLYDNAWYNGSDEYLMSEDPNFKPNGRVSGSWNQLEVVRPTP